jgi:LCP family protein required for cell wall assembly
MSHYRRVLAFSALFLSALACTVSVPSPDFVPDLHPQAEATTDPFANRTTTPTPFLPGGATAIAEPLTATPSPTASWGEFPGPIVAPALPIPPPIAPLPQPEGQIHILLLGSDQRPASGGFRTDTIVLLTINPEEDTAHLTSFPRDLYVYIPGWTMQRINTAHPRGGFELLRQTFQYNFGIDPDYFVLINFWGFEQGIDSLGGILVNSARPMTDHRDDYGDYTVPAGQVWMDGETALWYVRARYATSDFDRARRQQEVLIAAFNQLISLNALARVPELYNLYNDSVVTNLDLEDSALLLPTATRISTDSSKIRSFFIGGGQGYAYTIPSTGAWVFVPNRDAVMAIIREAANVPDNP